jgi:hypothetical protein
MKGWIGVGLLLLLLGTGCEPKKDSVEFVLTDEQLYHLMYDMFLSEAVLSGLKEDHQDSVRQLFWLRMTEVYDMSEKELRAEVEKIQTDPDKLRYVLDRVKQDLDSIR